VDCNCGLRFVLADRLTSQEKIPGEKRRLPGDLSTSKSVSGAAERDNPRGQTSLFQAWSGVCKRDLSWRDLRFATI
jgi:hypothetical protein